MKIYVILNGELKTCCSAYPTDQVQTILNSWFAGDGKVKPVVVDIQKEKWPEDTLFPLAFKYFGDKVFPLVYVGEKLAAIGNLPGRDDLWKMAVNGFDDEITKKDILDSARVQGFKVSEGK